MLVFWVVWSVFWGVVGFHLVGEGGSGCREGFCGVGSGVFDAGVPSRSAIMKCKKSPYR